MGYIRALIGERPSVGTPEFRSYMDRSRELLQRYDDLNAKGAFRSAPAASAQRPSLGEIMGTTPPAQRPSLDQIFGR